MRKFFNLFVALFVIAVAASLQLIAARCLHLNSGLNSDFTPIVADSAMRDCAGFVVALIAMFDAFMVQLLLIVWLKGYDADDGKIGEFALWMDESKVGSFILTAVSFATLFGFAWALIAGIANIWY